MLLALIAGLALRATPTAGDLVLLLARSFGAAFVRHIHPGACPGAGPVRTSRGLAGAAVSANCSRRGKSANFRTAIAILVLASFAVFTLVRVDSWGSRGDGGETLPHGRGRFPQREHPPAPILNHYNFGGYFIWKVYPNTRLYRWPADVYGDRFMDDFARAII